MLKTALHLVRMTCNLYHLYFFSFVCTLSFVDGDLFLALVFFGGFDGRCIMMYHSLLISLPYPRTDRTDGCLESRKSERRSCLFGNLFSQAIVNLIETRDTQLSPS